MVLCEHHFKVGSIIGAAGGFDHLGETGNINEFLVESDFFDAGDFVTLLVFDCCDVLAGFQQAVGSPTVQPGDAAAERLDIQFAAF
jgi:hypothetical protein